MLGFSIFLGDSFDQAKVDYIHAMQQKGFRKIFTSLHIPEDDSQQVLANLIQLGKLAKELNLEIMADISNDGLKRLGIELNVVESFNQLKEMGITGIRMDYGIEQQVIANASKVVKVGLNASTLTENDVEQLIAYQADFSQMELWHNYYPRPETGLSEAYLQQLNQKWQHLGMKIVAFVMGEEKLRGPLFEGLPTLESQRYQHPLAATIQLINQFGCHDVCIGDEGLSSETREQFQAFFQEQKIKLNVEVFDETHRDLFIGTHTNRQDDARDVIRSQEARFKNVPTIEASNTVARNKGSITLDNENYLRYMGELQILKRDLPSNPKVNVVAKIHTKDVDLVDCILPGYQFELSESRKSND